MEFLKSHPFSVKAHFDESTVLTFAIPKEKLIHLLPKCLELDIFNHKWGFIAMAMVQTKALRPSGFSESLGNNFFLLGYRIFVRYTTKSGRKLRGLYILKSETDKPLMEFLGNTFSHYNYSTVDIKKESSSKKSTVVSKKSKFFIEYFNDTQNVSLPEYTPFSTWKEASRYAGPMLYTFSVSKKNKKVTIVKATRKNWTPSPLSIQNYNVGFLKELGLEDCAILANAFQIKNVNYQWGKGIVELWN